MSPDQPGQSPPDLPATSYVVLGLLSFGRELTGYDLRKWAMNLRFFYWSPAQSQIYTELRRLRSHGLVCERTEPQRRRPDKRYYRITPAGLAAFDAWLIEEPVAPPTLKHPVALRLFFGHRAAPERLRSALTSYLEWARAQTTDLAELRAALGADFPYPDLVAAWGEQHYAAEIAAAEATLTALDQPPDHRATPDTPG
ncbi:helix-turn-helix transcriptional regulator [Natronosporangium hydrolyticum]|uniref:Helix-turn-helix transcriptional regulator n=1 Tax=Natronosporangium hydrolyticum TaxID=2811111 RepID=A0A895YIQ9_9ACTN|nr:PadR family transcriptional regulator [Natronosporangium hydrolyticum]QSB15419.1 helix-turn-helix transcriptional regulator [Natronosporangium hydrolyticum]